MKVKVSLEGDKAVRAELARLSVRYPGALAAALYGEGVAIYNEARKRVPVDSGGLRDSAYVTRPGTKPGSVRLEAGFGAPHATLQHQKDYRHTQGEKQYLQNAIDQLAGGMLQRVATQTQRNVEAGIQTVTALVPARKGSRTRGRMTRASKTVGSRRR